MVSDPALILVDMQNDFCKRGYGFHDEQSELADVQDSITATADLLDRYRASGRTPILVRTTHNDDLDSAVWTRKYEEKGRSRPCEQGSAGAEFVSELGVQDSDIVVTKHRYDAFHDTNLDTYLSANGITEVLLGGVMTNVCVESTARSAFDRDYNVTVLEDCVGSTDQEAHERSLANIESFFGTVQMSEEIRLADSDSSAVSEVSNHG